jgi:hypothetical protein
MSTVVASLVVGMNIASFERQSMTTRMAVNPFKGRSCLMKSMLIECQGLSGIGSVTKPPTPQFSPFFFQSF